MRELPFLNRIYREARHHVPAYKRFLKSHGIRAASLQSEADFKKLPIMDKEQYIRKYPLEDLFPARRLPELVYASSGSSGVPTFWFRSGRQEAVGEEIHERILRDIFKIPKQEATLAVISFSMGIWIAGHYTFASLKRLAERGRRISVVTPALEKEDTCAIIAKLAPHFKHVILIGYPPFLMDLVLDLERRSIPFPPRLYCITSGDSFREAWRDAVAERAGIKNKERNIISVYGSADATVMGYETPASVFIRRVAAGDARFADALFERFRPEVVSAPSLERSRGNGNDGKNIGIGIPGLVQYDPRHIFFEEVKGELVLTAPTAAPLIRYNLRDRGAVISYEAMRQLVREHGLLQSADQHGLRKFPLPFLVLKGRSDVAVTLYALNIYPEHIKAAIEVPALSRFLSGAYLAYSKTFRGEREEKLFVKLELKPGIRSTGAIQKEAERHVLQTLISLSTEFRRLYTDLQKKALPKVDVVRAGSLAMPVSARGILAVKGKKPRVVVS